MQLFAFDKNNCQVFAEDAQKRVDYTCQECGGVLRLRGGFHFHKHFFHIRKSTRCRQSQKTLIHLQVQNILKSQLPDGECELEKSFKEIRRIADAAWEAKKLVFEVQFSPISKEEVEKRNKDYASLGYTVVWILHDRRFNRLKATAAEVFLQGAPHYFTNIDSLGRGDFYDQVTIVKGRLRKVIGKVAGVNFSEPLFTDGIPYSAAPYAGIIKAREDAWGVSFGGDIVSRYRSGDPALSLLLKRQEELLGNFFVGGSIYAFAVEVLRKILAAVFAPYRLLLDILLEKLSR